MESNNQENAPLIGAKGIEAPRRLLLDLQKLQSEVKNNVPEGPRTYLRMDKSGQTQVLSVIFPSSRCMLIQSNTSRCACEWSADRSDEFWHSVQKDRHALVNDFDLPYRDLRVVDPLPPYPYPSDIMIRCGSNSAAAQPETGGNRQLATMTLHGCRPIREL